MKGELVMNCNYHVGDEPLFENDNISVFIDSFGMISVFDNESDLCLGEFNVKHCPECGVKFNIEEYGDCLSCRNSMSEEDKSYEYDKLWCIEKRCYVNEDDCCEEFNK